MNLDFILFTPPKIKYKFMDLWGQVVFIPKLVKKQLKQQSSFFSPFFNCVKNTTTTESHLTIDGSLLNTKDFLLQVEEAATQQQTSIEQEQIEKYIPCMYLDSMVKSQYLIIYFHASGEDIKLCHTMMNHLRNLYQINVLAMEYSGYSIYHGKTSSEIIKSDADYIYQYFVKKIGFKEENIIVVGRSIGTGIALNLMRTAKPRALALISSFSGIKSLAKQFAGKFGTIIAKETYDNISNIQQVNCPVFFLHGKKDTVVAYQNSIELAKYCKNKTCINISQKMTHSAFDFYVDFSQPLRQFLMQEGINFYRQNMNGPNLSDDYFKLPQNYKI